VIELYTCGTGNGWRASIALEECGLPYVAHKVDITRGEHHTPPFLQLSVHGKIPVIVDDDGPGGKSLVLGDSGAISVYCAEKCGRFLPQDSADRYRALQWVMHAVSDGGDIVGGILRLQRQPVPPAEAIALYRGRLTSLYRAADRHLSDREYLAGEISVADLAYYPVAEFGRRNGELDCLPYLRRWTDQIARRPGVIRGMAVPG
jgi:GST-like protein